MRKMLKRCYDTKGRSLVPDKSIVRYDDDYYVFHCGLVDPDTGKVKLVISKRSNGEVRIVHNRHRKNVELEYTMK